MLYKESYYCVKRITFHATIYKIKLCEFESDIFFTQVEKEQTLTTLGVLIMVYKLCVVKLCSKLFLTFFLSGTRCNVSLYLSWLQNWADRSLAWNDTMPYSFVELENEDVWKPSSVMRNGFVFESQMST